MTKICAVSPNPSDATSWYRSNGPLIRMQKEHDDIQFVEYGFHDLEWNVIMNFDILFMQRPCYAWQVALIHRAISYGLKIWIDFDDMLWDVHPSSPLYETYSNPEIKKTIVNITTIHPNYVMYTVSTHQLKTELEQLNPSIRNVHVVPNAYDEKLFGKMYEMFPGDVDLWRGSKTHLNDMLVHYSDLNNICRQNKFEFIGDIPWFLDQDVKENIKCIPSMGFLDYLKHLKKSAYRFAIYPLEDTAFNRCKSNIFFIEATYAGAVCIVPNWSEWSKCKGVFTYDPSVPGDLLNAYNKANLQMGADPHWHQAARGLAISYIENELTLDITNQQRYQLIKSLSNG